MKIAKGSKLDATPRKDKPDGVKLLRHYSSVDQKSTKTKMVTVPCGKAAEGNSRCKSCGFNFSRKAGLKRHNCYKKLKINNIMFSLYSCHECKVAYPSKYQLKVHINGHGPNTYKCDKCKASFAAQQTLMHHLCVRSELPTNRCHECGISFEDEAAMLTHMVSHNGSKRPYQCDKCGISLSGLHSLRCHKLVHQLDKPYKCKECGSAFDRKYSLTRHMSTTHTICKPYNLKPRR